MSGSERTSEASMDEILATIRKIIAEEPVLPVPPEVVPSPSATSASSPSALSVLSQDVPKSEPQQPVDDFFRSIIPARDERSTPAPQPTASAGARSLAAALDDEMGDLIDMPPSAPLAPQLSIDPLPATRPDPALAVEAAREKWANLIKPQSSSSFAGTSAALPETGLSIGVLPVQPPVQSPVPSAVQAPAGARSAGFYPPQDKLPAMRMDTPGGRPPLAEALPEPERLASTPSAAPSRHDLAPAVAVSAGSPAVVPSGSRGEAMGSAPVPTPAPLGATAAGAAALDALAVGLSKSILAEADPRPVPVLAPELDRQTTVPAAIAAQTQPVASPVTVAVSQPVTAPTALGPASTAEAPLHVAPGRPMEDFVADLMRPMLQKWIDENMPRIVERALRLDSSKDGR